MVLKLKLVAGIPKAEQRQLLLLRGVPHLREVDSGDEPPEGRAAAVADVVVAAAGAAGICSQQP